MVEESLITPEVRAMIGQEVVSRASGEGCKSSIGRLAMAVGDINALGRS